MMIKNKKLNAEPVYRSMGTTGQTFVKKLGYAMARLSLVTSLMGGAGSLAAKTAIGTHHDLRFNSAPSRATNLWSFNKLGIDPLYPDHLQFGGTEEFDLTKSTLEEYETQYLNDLDWHRFLRQYVFGDLKKTKDYLLNKEIIIKGQVKGRPTQIKITYNADKDVFETSNDKLWPKEFDVTGKKIAEMTIQNKNLNNFSVYANYLDLISGKEQVTTAGEQDNAKKTFQAGGFMIWPFYKQVYIGSETFGGANFNQTSAKPQVETTGANSVGQKGETSNSISNFKIGQQTTLATAFWLKEFYFQSAFQHYGLYKLGKDNNLATDLNGTVITEAHNRFEFQQELGVSEKYKKYAFISALKLHYAHLTFAKSLGSFSEKAHAAGVTVKDPFYALFDDAFYKEWLTVELSYVKIFGFKNSYIERLTELGLTSALERTGSMYGGLMAFNLSKLIPNGYLPTIGMGFHYLDFPGENDGFETSFRAILEKNNWALGLNADFRKKASEAELNIGTSLSFKLDFLNRPFFR